ncbi:MAG: hypothetical protein PVH68_03500 [Armatimonadota bacterium]|jgi:tetratricopeptide (TPR) repeat protein
MERTSWLCLCVVALLLAVVASSAQEIPTAAKSCYEAGMAAKKAGELSKAVGELSAAVKLAPSWADARWALGWTYAAQGNSERAIDELNWVIHLTGNAKQSQEAADAIARLGGEVKSPVAAVPKPPAPPPPPAATVAVPAAPPAAGDGKWHPSWDAALAAARASGRLILVHVYTPLSEADAKFAEETLRAAEVVAAAKEFECARLDSEGELPWAEAKEIEEEEGDEGPLVVFCRPDGAAHYIAAGALTPKQFLHYMGEARRYFQMEQSATAIEQQHGDNPQEPEACFELGRWYMLKGGADLRSILSAAFGAEGLAAAFAKGVPEGFGFEPMPFGAQPGMGGPDLMPPAGAEEDGPEGGPEIIDLGGMGEGMPEMGIGLWVGMERDEERAKQLRAKGAALLARFREQDPQDRLGHGDEIDLLLMQNAMIEERHAEAGALARGYVEQNPEGEGVALAYVVQAMASLSEQEGQEEGMPDFSEAKALLDKAMEAPGDEGSKMLAVVMRVVFEMMDALVTGFMEAFMEMGKEMEKAMPQP